MLSPDGRAWERWVPGSAEARSHALVLAVILWGFALATFVATPGQRAFTGRLKTGDFVHFYTLGTVAVRGTHHQYSDARALHAVQAAVLPASDREHYLPAYPPQTALVFAPLALLPFSSAYAAWAVVLLLGYASAVVVSWRRCQRSWDVGLVSLCALAFPPFWSLVLHGQTTVFPLLGVFLGWLSLEHKRPWLAGAAFGLIALKPQFGILLPVVLIAGRQWACVAGVSLAVLAQVAIVAVVMGPEPLASYISTLRTIPQVSDLLEPYPHNMHSLRTLTKLVPGTVGLAIWAALSAGVTWMVVRVWMAPTAPVAVRMGLLVLGTILVNPHVAMYDLTILALPIIWCGGWLLEHRPHARGRFAALLYGLAVLTLWPTASLVWVQGSVLLMAWFFWHVATAVLPNHPLSRDSAATGLSRAAC